MLRDIIKKEILETITSPKFVFTFLLCAVLILLSVYTGITNYRAEQKEYNAAVALNKKNLESQPSYQALAGLGTKINRPPQVLSAIASGIDEAVGRVATVNIAYDPNLVDSKYESNPVFSVFGALDLTFIVKIVLSLFAILFTYDAIVGEKERGTLKLTLSNRVPRDRLILGKVIGGYISLLIPLIIPLILSLLILLVFPNISMTGRGLEPAPPDVPDVLPLPLGLLHPRPLRLGPDEQELDELPHPALHLGHLRHHHPQGLGPGRLPDQAHPLGPRDHGQEGRLPPADPGGAQKEVMDWIKANAPKPGEDPKAFQEKFKKYLEEYQQTATSEDRRQQRRPGARLPGRKKRAQQNLAVNLSRISPGLGPDVLDDEPGPDGARRARAVPGLDPGLQAHLHQVGQRQDDEEHRFLTGRDRPARSSWTTCPSTRSSPRRWASRWPGPCPISG